MENLYRTTIAAVLVLSGAASVAETPSEWAAGDWTGALQAGDRTIEIVYHLAVDEEGVWTGSLDVPAQGAVGLRLQSIEISGSSMSIGMPLPGDPSYQGQWKAAEQIVEGRFTQAGRSVPMVLERAQPDRAGPSRPQEPRLPLPYRSEVVSFSNDGTVLAGTMTLPGDEGTHPGVVLVAGAGPHDRDGTFMNHRPLLVLADSLTRAGFAVLRFDERGIGDSDGKFATATAEQLAGDIAAATRFLREHDAVDDRAVGIVAHSEGGRLGALAIRDHQAADALVLLGAPARPGIAALRSQAARSPSPIAGLQLAMAEAVLGDSSGESAETAVRAAAERFLGELGPEQLAAFGGQEDTIVDQLAGAIARPQATFSLRFDPRPALHSADIPVLALYGENDTQIDVPGATEAWRDALGGDADVVTLARLNHFFQQSESGAPAEYATIEQTISPTVLATITDWLESHAVADDE